MRIKNLIELLQSCQSEEGNIEVFIYDSHGDQIDPKGLDIGCVARGREIEDYAYFSELE